ncbi:MAG: HAD family hydrolase [Gammaproteobacteria bacterium]|nr:HAD family hydrolase [Gammaproteobacteria bacterium]
MTVRIAMWSGPRNISTAMMRAWENRPDTCVVDEPLYAHYLAMTGINHPGAAMVMASQNTSWREVVDKLLHETPVKDCEIFYQKHMAHHQLPGMSKHWMLDIKNCFLIRDPDAVVASYAEKRPDLTPQDLGFSQQAELFEFIVNHTEQQPPVIDSEEFLKNPRRQLEKLCKILGIAFSENMLSWPPGSRDSDGVWAQYWYHNVEKSTGFMPWKKTERSLTREQQAIADACRPFYETLREHCLSND